MLHRFFFFIPILVTALWKELMQVLHTADLLLSVVKMFHLFTWGWDFFFSLLNGSKEVLAQIIQTLAFL